MPTTAMEALSAAPCLRTATVAHHQHEHRTEQDRHVHDSIRCLAALPDARSDPALSAEIALLLTELLLADFASLVARGENVECAIRDARGRSRKGAGHKLSHFTRTAIPRMSSAHHGNMLTIPNNRHPRPVP